MAKITKKTLEEQEILKNISAIFPKDMVIELRILDYVDPGKDYKQTISGYFTDKNKFAKEAAFYSGKAPAVYFTLNECKPDLLARANNRARKIKREPTTGDHDIIRRRFLPIDVDPKRPTGISANEQEHQTALDRTKEIFDWLKEIGFPDGFMGDSGNGGHLLYPIYLQNDKEALGLVSDCIKAIGEKFSDDKIDVDQKVYNAARIWKVYGTMAGKGDSVEDRPHRKAALLNIPDKYEVVPVELLKKLAAMKKPTGAPAKTIGKIFDTRCPIEDIDPNTWIPEHGMEIVKVAPWKDATKYILKECPFNADHKEAAILKHPGGPISFECFHNSCSEKTWTMLRDEKDPEWRQRNKKLVQEHKQKESGQTCSTPSQSTHSKKTNEADILITRLPTALEFFKSDGEIWVTVQVGDVKQNMSARSSGFKKWIRAESIKILSKHIGSDTAQKVAENLEAIAIYDVSVPETPVFVRLGSHAGKIYFDLANNKWQVVEIDCDGWRIITDPPVKFRRPNGMKPLPIPTTGGQIEDLRPLINASKEENWILIVAWIIGALHPTGPYSILTLQGEQGTAKSTMSGFARDLIDPSKASLRTVPREDNDIVIAANNGLVVAFDNLSGISEWLSDLLCRVSTGGGIGKRQLYTDSDEVIFNVKRPLILNGIDDIAHKADLRDRSLILLLDPISDEKRREEHEIRADYERLRPGIMGAIFTAVSTALRNKSRIKVKNLPRMADFAAWIVAAEPSLPWEAGKFLKIYQDTAHNAIETALEGSPVARAIRKFLEKRSEWTGYFSELLEGLKTVTSEATMDLKSWPKNPNGLSRALRRIAPELRRVGIEVTINRDHSGSHVILNKVTIISATDKVLLDDAEAKEEAEAPEIFSVEAPYADLLASDG